MNLFTSNLRLHQLKFLYLLIEPLHDHFSLKKPNWKDQVRTPRFLDLILKVAYILTMDLRLYWFTNWIWTYYLMSRVQRLILIFFYSPRFQLVWWVIFCAKFKYRITFRIIISSSLAILMHSLTRKFSLIAAMK